MIAIVDQPLDPGVVQLCEEYGIRRLAVFGSALRADFSPDSDVDVLVEFQPGETPGLSFFAIQERLSTLIGRTVDLNTPASLGEYFREEVLTEAENVYVAP